MNWDDYQNFTEGEFRCSHTGQCEMDVDFMDMLQFMRIEAGFPFRITSGYRDKTHPIEAAKSKPGEHSLGKACDISIKGKNVIQLLSLAHKHGFIRFGVSQRGSGRFIHLGSATEDEGFVETTWSY